MATLTPSVLNTALLVAWTDAWIAGACGPDDLADAVRDRRLRFPDTELDLLPGITRLRSKGARALVLALPRPGDPGGVSGGPDVLGRATIAGAAAICVGDVAQVLLPEEAGWAVADGSAAPQQAVPVLGAAERDLQAELAAATEAMSQLDLARERPDALALVERDCAGFARLPAALGDRALRVALQAARTIAILDVARLDDGRAATAAQVRDRLAVIGRLAPLETAARSALCAAVSVLAVQQVSR